MRKATLAVRLIGLPLTIGTFAIAGIIGNTSTASAARHHKAHHVQSVKHSAHKASNKQTTTNPNLIHWTCEVLHTARPTETTTAWQTPKLQVIYQGTCTTANKLVAYGTRYLLVATHQQATEAK